VRGFAVYSSAYSRDDLAAGEAYKRWVGAAAMEPTTLGTMWFQYRDEPVSGRGPCPTGVPGALTCGEHYAFGAADETDCPKYELVERMREANLCAGPERLAATDPQPAQLHTRPCGGMTGRGPGGVAGGRSRP
jgi:hypothetical protein